MKERKDKHLCICIDLLHVHIHRIFSMLENGMSLYLRELNIVIPANSH